MLPQVDIMGCYGIFVSLFIANIPINALNENEEFTVIETENNAVNESVVNIFKNNNGISVYRRSNC